VGPDWAHSSLSRSTGLEPCKVGRTVREGGCGGVRFSSRRRLPRKRIWLCRRSGRTRLRPEASAWQETATGKTALSATRAVHGPKVSSLLSAPDGVKRGTSQTGRRFPSATLLPSRVKSKKEDGHVSRNRHTPFCGRRSLCCGHRGGHLF
jgi:hypothetical protein